MSEIKEHCDDIIRKMKKRTEKWKRDTGKFNKNKDDQVIDDVSISGNYNNDMTNNNGDIIESVVLKGSILNNGSSDDEVLVGVEVSDEVVVVDESESCLLYTSRCV